MYFKRNFSSSSNTHQAFWIGIGSFSSFALGLASAAILSRYFEKTEYGTYRQILYVYNTLLVIFTAGLPRVFAYYLPRYSIAQGKDIVWKVSKLLFLTGFIFSVFLYVFSGLIADLLRNPELSIGLRCFSPIPMLLLPTLGIEGIFSSYKRSIFVATYNILTRVLMLFFIVLPVIIFKGSYLYAIYGWIVVSVMTLILAYYFKGVPFKGIKAVHSGLTFKEILVYSVPVAFASIAGIAIKAAYQFYISRYFGTEIFAEFSNGFIELPFAHMVTGAVSTVLMPVFSKIIFDKSDQVQIINLWHSSLLKSAIIIYPLVIFCMVFSKDLMIILYSSKYVASSIYFIIAMTVNFFNVIVFMPLLLSLGETRFYARLHIGFAFSAWILGYLVLSIFNSAVAIAAFSAIQSIAIIIVALTFISKRINVRFIRLFPIAELIKIGAHSLISVIVIMFTINHLLSGLGNFTKLFLSFIGFILMLVLISPLFHINYRSIYKTLLSR